MEGYCPEHGLQAATLNWNARGMTYDDGRFDFTKVFTLACGCRVREIEYGTGGHECYREKERDEARMFLA